jgi:hypothetical protein
MLLNATPTPYILLLTVSINTTHAVGSNDILVRINLYSLIKHHFFTGCLADYKNTKKKLRK